MDESKSHLFEQLSIYTEQIEVWERLVATNSCPAGETGNIKTSIKKNWLLIDALLDRYNNSKNLCAYP